jgi:hypothetical protein
MTEEQAAKLTDIELSTVAAIEIMGGTSRFIGDVDPYTDERIAFSPTDDLYHAFQLVDWLNENEFLITIDCMKARCHVSVAHKSRPDKYLVFVQNPDRCRAITEACVCAGEILKGVIDAAKEIARGDSL